MAKPPYAIVQLLPDIEDENAEERLRELVVGAFPHAVAEEDGESAVWTLIPGDDPSQFEREIQILEDLGHTFCSVDWYGVE